MPTASGHRNGKKIAQEIIGDCTLVRADCREYLTTLQAKSVQAIITDPPYGINYESRWCGLRRIVGDKTEDHLDESLDLLSLFRSKLDETGVLYWFCTPLLSGRVLARVGESFQVKNLLAWDKGNWTAGDLECRYGYQYESIVFASKGRGKRLQRRAGDVLRCARVTAGNVKTYHQNEKPVELMELLVGNVTNEGDLIVDPYMGSGSTAIACIKLKRRFIGCEIDPKHFATAVKRVRDTALVYDQESLTIGDPI